MCRAERLLQLVQILRNKRLVTAQDLAERLEVSSRTIYRDIRDVGLSGVCVNRNRSKQWSSMAFRYHVEPFVH